MINTTEQLQLIILIHALKFIFKAITLIIHVDSAKQRAAEDLTEVTHVHIQLEASGRT